MNIDTTPYKNLLLEEKKILEQELQGLGHVSGNQDGLWDTEKKESVDAADKEDVALSIEKYEEDQGTVRKLETQLHGVVSALEKIEQGTYGICETSGLPIEEDRLLANPSAKTCKAHMND
jgi:RNA polymerase-binding transcription factor DksA